MNNMNEALRSVVNRSFMMGGDIGKIAIQSTYHVGKTAYNVAVGAAKLAIEITDSRPAADESVVTSPEADPTFLADVVTVPEADVDRVITQAVASGLGPMTMFLLVNQEPDGKNR